MKMRICEILSGLILIAVSAFEAFLFIQIGANILIRTSLLTSIPDAIIIFILAFAELVLGIVVLIGFFIGITLITDESETKELNTEKEPDN